MVICRRFLGFFQIVLIIMLLLFVVLGTGWGSSTELKAEGDFNSNGVLEEYILKDKTLTVLEGDKELWRSPGSYAIDNMRLADITNDGKVNLVISLWKKGSFDKIKPFWYTGKDDEYKQHLFIYEVETEGLRPSWCSSSLDRPIVDFEIIDYDGDGLNELVSSEGQYKRAAFGKHTIDGKAPIETVIMQWTGWGLLSKE